MFTKAQIKALFAVYNRRPLKVSYLQFRRTAFPAFGNCLMVPWCGMILGIEADGSTHS